MSLAEAKKQEISQLWGLSILEIDTKLIMLQSVICNVSDYELLDCLLKADLNINETINLYFANTLSSSPSNNNHNNNNNNNQYNNNNSIIDNIENEDEYGYNDDDEDDDLLILNVNNNNNNNTNSNRKRKRDEMNDEDIDTNKPRNKRRKIDLNDDGNTNTSNCNNSNSHNNGINNNINNDNHNLSMKMEQIQKCIQLFIEDSDDDDMKDMEENENKMNMNDTNWKRKRIGTLKIEYSQKKPRSVNNLHELHYMMERKKIHIKNVEIISSLRDKGRMNKLHRECIEELSKTLQSRGIIKNISITLKNRKYIEESMEEKEIHENQRRRSYKRATIIMEFEIELIRLNAAITTFSMNIPYTLGLFGGSKQLLDKIMKYKKKKDTYYSMVSLLDFAIRDKYDINERNNNESYNHGLNIKLHEYQLQSLDFMITEENHPIGFYRHFYEKGKFADNTSFQYSPTFRNLIINKSLPIAHGGLLCDEMGLGKTLISLALINCNKPRNLNEYSSTKILKIAYCENQKKSRWDYSNPEEPALIRYNEEYKWYKSKTTLIIAPVSLIGQWEKECDEKSGKKIQYKRYYGSRSRDVTKYIDKDIVFTTYGILGHEDGDDRENHVLHQIEWHRIILDESYYIKNGNCKTSKSIHSLKAVNKWCLTGTPFGTQIYDICNQLKFVGLKQDDLDELDFNGTHCNGLMHVIQSMVMRHKKTQKFNNKPIVAIPEKTEDIIFIDFTSKQKEYYDKLYNTAFERYNYYKSTGNIGRGSIAILSSLHPARQACSGYIYSKDNIEQQLSDAQATTFRIKSMVKENTNRNLSRQQLFEMAKDEAFNNTDGECPICYECPFDEPLQTPCRHIFCGECIRSILENKNQCPMCRKKVNISQLKKPPSKQQDIDENHNKKEEDKEDKNDNDDEIRFDSKLKVLISELKKIRQNGLNEKSLIFTSFSKSLDWICNELKENGFEYRTLTGSMSMNKRKKELNEFSNNNNVNIFVLTVRSGAVGITLTAANHVFMLEPPFNAALHRQAINRVHRLGQKKKVFIHTLIMKGSIEEKIWNINKNKQNVNNNNNLAGNISRDKSANLEQHEITKLFE